ncbi:hypothetical protein VH570_06610 [Sphingobium sp. HT1-2]|uniref:hypothetical protein n=1 Tax=Sphingobium sp. HT1-2 TaxID=3111640 RepID=UPI003C0A3352
MATYAYGPDATKALKAALTRTPKNKSIRGEVDWNYNDRGWGHYSLATGRRSLRESAEKFGCVISRGGANMHVYSDADLAVAKNKLANHVLTDPISAGMTTFIHNPSQHLVRRVLEMPPSEAGVTMGCNDTIGSVCFVTPPAWLDESERKSIKARRAHSGHNYSCHVLDACFDYVTVKEAEAATADMAQAA